MRLSEAEEVKAGELGLTLPEMRMAKSMRISPEACARQKLEMAAERAADDALMGGFVTDMDEHTRQCLGPPAEESG